MVHDSKAKDCVQDDLGELVGEFTPDKFTWGEDDGVLKVFRLKAAESARTNDEAALGFILPQQPKLREINERNARFYRPCRSGVRP